MNIFAVAALLTVCMGAAHAGPFKFKFSGEGGPHSSTQRTSLVGPAPSEPHSSALPISLVEDESEVLQSIGEVTLLVEDSNGEIFEGVARGGQSANNVVKSRTTSGAIAAQAVAEPSTFVLLLAIPAVMVLRRRITL